MGTALNPTKTVEVRVGTAEVVGKGDLINGVFGSSRRQTGVVGHSDTFVGVSGDGKFIGVSGTSSAGTGVSGEATAAQGIGVHGKGGRLAGLFEGNVEVTGSLAVKGVVLDALLERIVVLEDQVQQASQQAATQPFEARIAALEKSVAGLNQSVATLFTLFHSH